MNGSIFTQNLSPSPFCQKQILRYAGVKKADEGVLSLMRECLKEAEGLLSGRICYGIFPLTIREDRCEAGAIVFRSRDLAKALSGCDRVLMMGATVGIEIDRLIAKYGALSPARALMMQAIGTERIEALCDAFCKNMAEELGEGLTPRFSPGYGDLSLEAQRDLFSLLDCPRRIGLTLSDSMMMSPSKSVTALVGIGKKSIEKPKEKCAACNQKSCAFRGNK